jgi:quinol monooxygenase YgiN
MRNQISWRVKLALKSGQLDNFQALTGEMVEFTRTEPGVLSYERFVSDDGNFVHVYERYADSYAAVAHLIEFRQRFAARFSSMVERKEFTVYGNPSSELKLLLDGFGAIYLRPLGDFEYWS